MIFRISLFFCFLHTAILSFSQQVVTIPVQTKDHATVLQTDNENRVGIIYFGKKF